MQTPGPAPTEVWDRVPREAPWSVLIPVLKSAGHRGVSFPLPLPQALTPGARIPLEAELLDPSTPRKRLRVTVRPAPAFGA